MDAQSRLNFNFFDSRSQQNSSYSQLPSLIEKHRGQFLPASTNLMLKIANSFNLKIHISVTGERLTIKGFLCYCNGYPVKIADPYKSFFLNRSNLGSDQQSAFYEYLKDSDSFGFLRQFRIKAGEPVSYQTIEETTSELIKTIPKIINTLELAGLKEKSRRVSSQLKVHEIRLRREVSKLLKRIQPINQESRTEDIEKEEKCVKIVEKIEEKDQKLSFEKSQIRKGGYFQIQKKQCLITDNGEEQIKELAVKKLKKNRMQNEYCNQKLNKEWKIIKQIKNQKHCLTYWKAWKEDEKKMVMDYVQNTLETQMEIDYNIHDILDYSSQIVEAISILHESGIVHRDLKPENFLVKKQNGHSILKVIDFGESVLMNSPFDEKECSLLGCTLPFSPLECSSQTEQGFNKKEIDIWSIGMILYQMLFGRIPVTYSRCFGSDIAKGWNNSDEFSIFPLIYKRKGIKIIQQIYIWIAVHTLCIKQKDRISLESIKKILLKTKEFLHDINKIE